MIRSFKRQSGRRGRCVVIPSALIEQCKGLDADTVEVVVIGGEIRIRPAEQGVSFPLRIWKWTFNDWDELAGFAGDKARVAVDQEALVSESDDSFDFH